MQGGNVWEKAGVNVSVVYGSMPPEAYRAATGTAKTLGKEDGGPQVPFAILLSSLLSAAVCAELKSSTSTSNKHFVLQL